MKKGNSAGIEVFRRIEKIIITLTRQGLSHTLYLIYIYLVSPYMMMVLPHILAFYKTNKLRMEKYLLLRYNFRKWRKKKNEILELGHSRDLITINDLGLSEDQRDELRKIQDECGEVVIAEIDQDGFFLSHFGTIRNLPMVSDEKFLRRSKFTLTMVSIMGNVGIKKDYRGNKLAFINELRALHTLRFAGRNVPSIMDVDFDSLTLTYSYILGSVLREELAKRGAVLRDSEVENNPDLAYLDPKKKWLRRIQEGKRILYDVIDIEFVESLFKELRKTHELGFIWNDIKYGNVIIEEKSGNPYFFDFDMTDHYPSLPMCMFRLLSDHEIELFNLHFDTQKLTYARMKEEIDIIKKNEIYAPIYFCSDLKIGNLFNNDNGYGRWHYILKQNLPSLSGKRILDLGANNASNSIQMLRRGATEVIAVEINDKNIEQGRFIKRGFEWTDNRKYNLKYIHANMKDIVEMNLGRFDIVLALCSIYYLDDVSIANLVQYISTITNLFYVQCNTLLNINRSDPYTYVKASVEYNLRLLKDNGFPFIQVISPYRYSRPLIIAKKNE